MAVTVSDVRSVAALARLRFTPEEEEVLTGELNGILEYVEKLNELDTEGVETTSHVLSMVNAFRKDEAEPFSSLDGLKASAPSIQDGYFRVPRIID